MPSFTQSPMELPNITFVDISLSDYYFILFLHVEMQWNKRTFISPDSETGISLGSSMYHLIFPFSCYLWLFFGLGEKVPILTPASSLLLLGPVSWRHTGPGEGAAGCVLAIPSSAWWYRSKPLDFCSIFKLILSKSCPLGCQKWQVSDRPWNFFHFFFFFQSVSIVMIRDFKNTVLENIKFARKYDPYIIL